MSDPVQKKHKLSAEVRAAAAAWLARLRAPDRTALVEDGLRRWLAEHPDHAAAFELLTDTWEKSARLKRRPLERVASWEKVEFRVSLPRISLALGLACVVAVITTLVYLHTDTVMTGVGESRLLVLEDGTRAHLNTNTRVAVRYTKGMRRVDLERGEVMFEVAKQTERPFIVFAGGRKIRALGTAFLVRRDAQNLAVTLVDGKVAVSTVSAGFPAAQNPRAVVKSANEMRMLTDTRDSGGTFTLSPGQRLTFAVAGAMKIDRPSLERVTAWERGQVSFDNTPLADAVAEMNRYSHLQIVIQNPAAGAIRVSGIFETSDSNNFARAVAETYGLKLRDGSPDSIVLGSAGM